MYKIIGGNSKEQGQVSFDQLCQWIEEGKVSGDSLVQAEGAAEWRPLGAYPEFAGALQKTAQLRPLTSAVSQAGAGCDHDSSLSGPVIPLPKLRHWAWKVVILYGLCLLVLTVPVVMVAFAPHVKAGELLEALQLWPYWGWLGIMMLCQMALLRVPVRVASGRPTSRRSLLWPVITTGFLVGLLFLGGSLSVLEFIYQGQDVDHSGHWVILTVLGITLAVWAGWSVVFHRLSGNRSPSSVVARQCQLLLRGSVLELLIAVPTHIVARYRDYCCAGIMTFVGLTFGIALMLLSFGPSVFFLYVARWKRLHPEVKETDVVA